MPVRLVRSLSGKAHLLEAQRRRAMGDYSRETLGAYARAWQVSQSPHALLQLCLFRHELGYHLPASWNDLLATNLPKLRGTNFEAATMLSCRRRKATQDTLRRKFEEWLKNPGLRQIAVVGNSASLLGAGQAGPIEAADAVVRFNHWQAPAADVGHRTDWWVRSPLDLENKDTPHPNPPPLWVAASGPDMACRRPEWDRWTVENGDSLLSAPLPVWRALVRELQAPPTAGLLALNWLRSIRNSWDGVIVYGIGYKGGRYHAAKQSHRPSHRHDWEKESALLQRWTTEGLRLGKN